MGFVTKASYLVGKQMPRVLLRLQKNLRLERRSSLFASIRRNPHVATASERRGDLNTLRKISRYIDSEGLPAFSDVVGQK